MNTNKVRSVFDGYGGPAIKVTPDAHDRCHHQDTRAARLACREHMNSSRDQVDNALHYTLLGVEESMYTFCQVGYNHQAWMELFDAQRLIKRVMWRVRDEETAWRMAELDAMRAEWAKEDADAAFWGRRF